MHSRRLRRAPNRPPQLTTWGFADAPRKDDAPRRPKPAKSASQPRIFAVISGFPRVPHAKALPRRRRLLANRADGIEAAFAPGPPDGKALRAEAPQDGTAAERRHRRTEKASRTRAAARLVSRRPGPNRRLLRAPYAKARRTRAAALPSSHGRPEQAAARAAGNGRPEQAAAPGKAAPRRRCRRRTGAGARGLKARRAPVRAGCSCRSRTDDTSPEPGSGPSA